MIKLIISFVNVFLRSLLLEILLLILIRSHQCKTFRHSRELANPSNLTEFITIFEDGSTDPLCVDHNYNVIEGVECVTTETSADPLLYQCYQAYYKKHCKHLISSDYVNYVCYWSTSQHFLTNYKHNCIDIFKTALGAVEKCSEVISVNITKSENPELFTFIELYRLKYEFLKSPNNWMRSEVLGTLEWVQLRNYKEECIVRSGDDSNYHFTQVEGDSCTNLLLCEAYKNTSIIKRDEINCGADEYSKSPIGNTEYCYSIVTNRTIASEVPLKDVLEANSIQDLVLLKELLKFHLLNETSKCLVNVSSLKLGFQMAAIHADGILYANEEHNCIIRRTPPSYLQSDSDMYLNFDEANSQLSMIIYTYPISQTFHLYGTEYGQVIECVTKDTGESVTYRTVFISFNTIVVSKFVLDLVSKYPRVYACSYVKNPNEMVFSNEVRAHGDTVNPYFAVRFHYYSKLETEFEKSFIKGYIADRIPGNIYFEIYTVTRINEATAEILLHLEDVSGNYNGVMDENDTYQLMISLENQLGLMDDHHLQYVSINNVHICFTIEAEPSRKFNWMSVPVGHRSSTDENCLNEKYLPYTRLCRGDLIVGGEWEEFDEDGRFCQDKDNIQQQTIQLFAIKNSIRTSNVINNSVISDLLNVTSNQLNVLPVDFIQVAEILQLSVSKIVPGQEVAADIVDVVDNIMLFRNDTIRDATFANLNSTNILLDSLDNWNNRPVSKLSADGVSLIRAANLIVAIIDPEIQKITGLSLNLYSTDNSSDPNDLNNYEIQYLYMNQSLDQLLHNQSADNVLQLATFLPTELYSNIEANNINNVSFLRIVISIFSNDILFQTNQSKLAEKVISVSIPGYPEILPARLPLIFRTEVTNLTKEFCGYFNFHPQNQKFAVGEWDTLGCSLLDQSVQNNLVACGCFHLTHFSFLISGHQFYEYVNEDGVVKLILLLYHNDILDWITKICSVLSMIGIFFIILTSLVFRRWRRDLKNRIILQFSLAIALQIILIVVADSTVATKKTLLECVLLGSSLQYIILVTFFWMLILAMRQYELYVKVFNTQITAKFFIMSMIVGWGLPLIPTIISASCAPTLYTPIDNEICYPKGVALYFGLVMPIAIVVIINLIIFIVVLHNVFKNATVRKSSQKFEIAQLRVAIFLFFFLGLTWIFGLIGTISTYENSMKLTFSYIFNLTATLQGFIIFIYYIIMSPSTRKLWIRRIRRAIDSDTYNN